MKQLNELSRGVFFRHAGVVWKVTDVLNGYYTCENIARGTYTVFAGHTVVEVME